MLHPNQLIVIDNGPGIFPAARDIFWAYTSQFKHQVQKWPKIQQSYLRVSSNCHMALTLVNEEAAKYIFFGILVLRQKKRDFFF